ncbi:hypothetical protein TNCV_499811 [Trichonephila clavipes]|nr:hypothetical protein TNCV_499811 [Trichonephila clavipes]
MISEVMFVSPFMIASKAALESEKIASPSVVPESSRWVEYRMSASLIARSSLSLEVLRSREFKKIDPKFNLLFYPIASSIDTTPEQQQHEQSDPSMREFFNATTLTFTNLCQLKNSHL